MLFLTPALALKLGPDSHPTSHRGETRDQKLKIWNFCGGGGSTKHGCFFSLVLEREILAAAQCHLGGFGRHGPRGGVPQSRTLVGRLAAGSGHFRRSDTLRKVGTHQHRMLSWWTSVSIWAKSV